MKRREWRGGGRSTGKATTRWRHGVARVVEAAVVKEQERAAAEQLGEHLTDCLQLGVTSVRVGVQAAVKGTRAKVDFQAGI